MKKKLDDIDSTRSQLKSLGTKLETKIAGIKDDLDGINCGTNTACQNEITNLKNKLGVTIDFNSLPDIQDFINKIANVQGMDLKQKITDVRNFIVTERSFSFFERYIYSILVNLVNLRYT